MKSSVQNTWTRACMDEFQTCSLCALFVCVGWGWGRSGVGGGGRHVGSVLMQTF